jgi:hypothetical protein
MAVISLVRYRDRETHELLSSLALLAEHLGGSVMTVYRSPDGSEKIAATGIYRSDPAKAVKAAMRISIALAGGMSP